MTSLQCALIVLGLFAWNGCKSDLVLSRNKRAVPINASLVNQTYVLVRNISQGPNVRMRCSPYSVEISVNQSFIDTLNVSKVAYLVMLDSNKKPFNGSQCRATLVNGSYHFRMDRYFGQCAYSVNVEGNGYLHVKFSICVMPDFGSSFITRDHSVFLYTCCKYESRFNSSLRNPLIPFADTNRYLGQFVLPESGALTNVSSLTFRRYSDASFSTINQSSVVLDGSRIFLSARLDVDSRFPVVLQTQRCVASPSTFPFLPSSPVFNLVQGGCPAPDPITPNGNVVYNNYNNASFEFSFLAFHWSAYPINDARQLMNVYCFIDICDNSDNQCTNHSCGSARRRRSASSNQKVISFGPLTVQSNEPRSTLDCDKNEMGCQYQCVVKSNKMKQCSCPVGKILQFDGKTCISDMQEGKVGSSILLQSIHQANNVLVLVIIFLLVVFNCTAKKTSK